LPGPFVRRFNIRVQGKGIGKTLGKEGLKKIPWPFQDWESVGGFEGGKVFCNKGNENTGVSGSQPSLGEENRLEFRSPGKEIWIGPTLKVGSCNHIEGHSEKEGSLRISCGQGSYEGKGSGDCENSKCPLKLADDNEGTTERQASGENRGVK